MLHRTEAAMALPSLRALLGSIGITLLLPGAVAASWPSDPMVNVPVCTAPDNQYVPRAVSDGAGGAIVAWMDRRDGVSYDIYAQHVRPGGDTDPAWPVNGVPVC